ncbi:MAG: hypothetical protein RMJ98_03915 [Myxococcales bacterium]|nr:DUF483 domain-containing protein [Polyangiaceae bacterium]MDW8248435.1 hypothetical protein [Myxococcales bacterium]
MSVLWLAPRLFLNEDTVPELLARRTRLPLQHTQVEDMALVAGIKPLVLRELPWEGAEAQAEFFRQRGLCALLRASEKTKATSTVWLMAGRSEAQVGEVAELMMGGLPTTQDHRRLGSLLGYPPCCVNTFCEHPSEEYTRMEQAAARTRPPGNPWLNVLDPWVFRLISWEPCSFQCALSATYADRLEALLRPHFRSFLQRTREVLSGARLYLHPNVQLTLEGDVWDDGFLPRLVAPTARDREGVLPLTPEDEADVARALREVRAAQKVTCSEGQIFLDGRPWARGFLVRFRG